MSGFGQNPAGSSAFSFTTLSQPNATAQGAAPAFNFGAPKTTATAIPLGSSPAFGVSPTLGVKSNISLTPAIPTSAVIPTLGSQQPGSLFGTTWTGGMFTAGSTVDASPTTAATLPSLTSAPTATAKTVQFSFGTTTPASTPQTLGLVAASVPATTNPPGFSQLAAPPPTQATVTASGTPTLNFSFGSAANTTTAAVTPSLGLSVPSFNVAATPKSQAPVAAPPPPQTATAVVGATTFTTPASLSSTTTLKFSVASSSTPVAASLTAPLTVPLTSVAKTAAPMGMPLFTGPMTSAPPPIVPAVPLTVSATTSVAPVPSAPTLATTSAGASVTTTTTAAPPATTTTAGTSEEDVMTYSKLQENINKWAMELEKQEKIFLHQATEMNGWERVIVENSDKLHMLNSKIEKVRKEQSHLDLELDYILSQQNELDYMLKGLEKEWGSVPPSDPERQHTYKIAESLDYKLKLMSEDLKEVVDHMNAMNYPPNDEFNPVMQIVRILNAHMNVLLMVERKTNLADGKVKDVGKLLELCKRDYDRAHHLYFH